MLNDKNLKLFMETFLGYGNLDAPFWFIGMEEGGGNSFIEINNRINYWISGGKKELEDVAHYHEKLGMGCFFNSKPKNQSTWNKLIRIMLAYNGEETSLQNVKLFQSSRFGRENSNNCLIELFPLPSPSTGKWLYSELSKILWLQTRKEYKQHLLNSRVGNIKNKIAAHRPKLIVCYGNNSEYRDYWSMIADDKFEQIEIDGKTAYISECNGTFLIVVNHPVSTGITNDYFHQVGKFAQTKIVT